MYWLGIIEQTIKYEDFIMNGLVYDWNGNLMVRKENGLEYTFENCDKPDLGFDYEVIIYEDVEVKILEWNEELSFEDQEKIPLSPEEKDAVEDYILNSEPPLGHSLQQQYVDKLTTAANQMREQEAHIYDFETFMEAVYAGREGSNHPQRANARRVLEFTDALYCVLEQVVSEVVSTREDHLNVYDHYLTRLPIPSQASDSMLNG